MSDDRYAPPTDEDLRHEVELTRQELGGTLARLLYKVDVPSRTRDAVHTKLNAAKETADHARHHPLAIGGLLALLTSLAAVWIWLRR